MQIKSNKIKDIREHYLGRLIEIYPLEEAASMFDLLLESLTGISRTQRATDPGLRASESEILKIHFAVKDLLKHRPLQYILGNGLFWGLKISVDERVLIPRPETEELVEWIIASAKNNPPASILDIGTGSGCIALALKKSFPDSTVTAVDASEGAIEVARKNAGKNGLDIEIYQANLLNEEIDIGAGNFGIIVSNPPYVRNSEKDAMRRNVLDYEPGMALFVDDDDPLIFYRLIGEFALQRLSEGGRLFLEINENLGPETAGLLSRQGFANVTIRKDLAGKDRMISAKKH